MKRIYFGEPKEYEDGILDATLYLHRLMPLPDELDLEKARQALWNIEAAIDELYNFALDRKTEIFAVQIQRKMKSSRETELVQNTSGCSEQIIK